MNEKQIKHRQMEVSFRITLYFLVIIFAVLVCTKCKGASPEVLALLKAKCFQCHGTTRDDWDASSPEDIADFSEAIVTMTEDESMPPGKLTKLTTEEKELVATLLENSSQPPIVETPQPLPPQLPSPTIAPPPITSSPIKKQRPHLTQAWVREQIENDPRSDLDTVYFSFDNRFNAGCTKEELADLQGALSKALNLLSTAPQIIVPRKLDPNGIVMAVEVGDLLWSREDLIAVIEAYPYVTRGWFRGDWLIARVLKAPLYYEVMDFPKTLEATDALFGVDRERWIANGLVKRTLLNSSRVAFHNRAIEWAFSRYGSVRMSYDSANEEDDRLFIANPFGPKITDGDFQNRAFQDDAREYIADLPNGLPYYAAFNAAGERQDTVPENIASDPSQYSSNTTIVPGLSCAACHKTGTQPIGFDVARDSSLLFNNAELARASLLYPPEKEFERLMKRDEARFLKAVHKAIDPFTNTLEPIGPVALQYNRDIDLKTAAIEVDMSVDRLRSIIEADAELHALGVRPLVAGRTIPRNTWESLESGISPPQRIAQLSGR